MMHAWLTLRIAEDTAGDGIQVPTDVVVTVAAVPVKPAKGVDPSTVGAADTI